MDDVKVLREAAEALSAIADRLTSEAPKPDFTLARQLSYQRFRGHPFWKRLEGTPWENDAPTIAAELMCMYARTFRLADSIEREEAKEPASFQDRVREWAIACFGVEVANDELEREDRMLEETFEYLQAKDYPKERIAALRDYVWSRPAGDPHQELGGVMLTWAALSSAAGYDMASAGETELARVWTKVDVIRSKQAAKPKGSALPIVVEPNTALSEAEDRGWNAALKAVVDALPAEAIFHTETFAHKLAALRRGPRK